MQVEYMKLCKKKRALDSKFQVLQELCSKLRQENDALKVEASHKGDCCCRLFAHQCLMTRCVSLGC